VSNPHQPAKAHFAVVSLFPEMLQTYCDYGVVGRAFQRGICNMEIVTPRDYSHDKHGNVDDRPYGGGPGMVASFEPWRDAIRAAKAVQATAVKRSHCVYLSPQGSVLQQADLQRFAQLLLQGEGLVLVCGRYEGLDERLIKAEIDQEYSIGDFVISGGELAALVMIDGIARLLPEVLGDEDSAANDSFSHGLLDSPHYTRPERIAGMSVPAVLLSGDHAAIRRWRLQQALGQTWLKRPDLLSKRPLSEEEQELLLEFQQAHAKDSEGS